MVVPCKEFNLCVLGSSGVGKTSFLDRLEGKVFKRGTVKATDTDEAVKYSIDVSTSSSSVILFNLFDWNWDVKRKSENINQQLMRGPDGVVFLYDIGDRRSKSDFVEFSDWYSRAAGFDKPCIIVSTKNDSKKRAVQDDEGKAMATKGDRRAYVPVSLVDDTGIDEFCSTLCKLMMNDLNITATSYSAASEDSLKWSEEMGALRLGSLGLGLDVAKQSRVILVAMNSSVKEKFAEAFSSSQYLLECVAYEEELTEIVQTSDGVSLPIAAVLVPPTASAGQQERLTTLCAGLPTPIKFVASVPRNALAAISGACEKSSL